MVGIRTCACVEKTVFKNPASLCNFFPKNVYSSLSSMVSLFESSLVIHIWGLFTSCFKQALWIALQMELIIFVVEAPTNIICK